MFLLGHLGIGLGLAWLVSYRHRSALDFRLVLLGSILPDLIDKPLGAILHLQSRLWAHSLLFLACVLAIGLAPRLRGLRWVGFGDAVHLLLDLIWGQPLVVLWPALGLAFPPETAPQSIGGYLQIFLSSPYVQFGEAVGGIVLLAAAWRYGLFSWPRLRTFLRDGRLVRPETAAVTVSA